MYWREIPVQIQTEDEHGQVSKPLDGRFQEAVDLIALFEGSSGGDEYMQAWEWGRFTEVEGNAEEVSNRLADWFNNGFPDDFVARVRELHRSGQRDTRPGAIDHWAGG